VSSFSIYEPSSSSERQSLLERRVPNQGGRSKAIDRFYPSQRIRSEYSTYIRHSRRWTCSSRVSSGDLLAKCVTQQNFLYFLQYLLSANFISFLNSIFKFISLSCFHSSIQIKISINTFYKNRIQSRKNGLLKMSFLKFFREKSNCSTSRLFPSNRILSM
jgi:hypothetical protein